MNMNISQRTKAGVTIVDVQGQLTMGAAADRFRQFIERQGGQQLLINLRGITYLDSSGLGELVTASQRITEAGGVVKLVNANRRISDLLLVAKLYSIFENFDDEKDALATFDRAA